MGAGDRAGRRIAAISLATHGASVLAQQVILVPDLETVLVILHAG